jgi:Flp pilus assembly protein TadD
VQYREAIGQKPNDPTAHKFLAIALAGLGQVQEASNHFREAVQFAPEDAEAHYGLACILVRLGKRDQASAEFKETLRLHPNHPEAVNQLQQLERKKL